MSAIPNSNAASGAIPPRPKHQTPAADDTLAMLDSLMSEHRAFMRNGGLPVDIEEPADPETAKRANMTPEQRAADDKKPKWFAGDAVVFENAKKDFEETEFNSSRGPGITAIRTVTFGTVLTAAAIGAFSTAIPGANAVAYTVFLSAAIPFVAGFIKKATMKRRMSAAVGHAARAAHEFPSSLGELQQAVKTTTSSTFDGRVARVLFSDKLREMRAKNEPIPLSARKLQKKVL